MSTFADRFVDTLLPMTPKPLGSRYLLDAPLGQGGMGIVWRGRDRESGAPCAIKILRPELAADPGAVTRFVRERTALIRFRHPNVVTLQDMIVEGEILALVMDLVTGGDLDDHRRRRGGTLPLGEALELTAQICDALAAAHAAGIVHRDLKPANVLISGGQAQLADFGIARIAGETTATTTGAVVGTISFMAPEVINGQEPTPACDVYAAGVTLYELLAGTPPFTGQVGAIIHGHLLAAPDRPAGLPDEVWALVSACLDKNPAARPSAAAVARALRNPVLSLATPRSVPLPAATQTVNPVRSAGGTVVFGGGGASGGPPPYAGGRPPYTGGPPPYAGGPPPYTGGPPPYAGGPPPYTGGPPPYAGGPGRLPGPRAPRRRALLATAVALLLVLAGVTARYLIASASPAGNPTASQSSGMAGVGAAAQHRAAKLPCDIYRGAGTPCVAAYSTTRALYAAYDGPLYQVKRASDGTTANVGLLSAGGYADAAEQDAFCADTSCVITELFDQSPEGNNLTIEAASGASGADVGANASALPVEAGGHKVYGLYIAGQTGYRDDNTKGVAASGTAEGMYMVASGTHVNSGCCFDFGNVETSNNDDGHGHMDAVNLGTKCYFAPCTGSGPWVEADMENGLFSGSNGSNTANDGNASNFVTAMLKNNGQTTYALKGGNADSGGLSTWWEGALPDIGGYAPMHQEGGIVLGTGGDGSNNGVGSFFEGVMTSGYPSDATDNAVQASIVAAGYSGASNGESAAAHTIRNADGQCVDVIGNDTGTDLAFVDLWACQSYAVDQHWTHNSDDSLETLGRCLDIDGDGTAPGTKVELYDCNGVGGQKWVQQSNGALLNPQSGLCLDDPGASTANGTQLQIYTCNGTAAQQFKLG
jgi:non-reducing end alpha-L-arabinofuranosidase